MKKIIEKLSFIFFILIASLILTSWRSIAQEQECIPGIEAEYDEGEPYCPPEYPTICCSCYVIPACVCCPESHSICTPMNYCCDGLPCLAEMVYRDNEEALALLRAFRNDILSQSAIGQELIKLYYQWSPVIVKAMEEDEEFKDEVKEMIDGVLELVGGEVE